jgi:hypothetical protein
MVSPVGIRRTKLPELSSAAKAPVPPAVVLFIVVVVIQWVRPWESNSTSSGLLLMASFADEEAMTGLSRLATHTTVRSGTLLYQMPMYKLLLELPAKKKPRAKAPSLEMSTSPGESALACVRWSSSDWHNKLKRRMRMGIIMQALAMSAMLVSCDVKWIA